MADEILSRDQNRITVLGGVTDDSNLSVTMLRVDPTTKRLLVSATGVGSGTVTSVSVVTANGFAGSVATATTTPVVTLSTTVTGLLKGNGTAISAAVAGTDYADASFKTISISGQSDVVADSAADTLTLVAGSNITLTTNAATDTITIASSGGASGITIGTTTITSGTTTRILYDNAGVVGEYTISGSGTVVAMATAPTFGTSITGSYLTASSILITDGSKNIISADTATYPSLTELSYVKGVTSAIQTQINAKGAGTVTAIGVTTANGVSGSSSGGATPNLTITLGAITPTTVNGNTFTTGTYTLTGQAGKTLTFNGSITLTGTDAQTYTFPTTSATIARTDAGQTFTGVDTFTSPVIVTSIDTSSASFTAFAGATTLMTIGGTGASASSFFPSTLDTSSSVTGAIRTSGGISAAKSANIGTTITVGTGYQIGGAAASGKILIGNGTNFVASTPTFPNASATSGKIIKSDGTNWVASTETYATPGASGQVMTSDGTNWTSATASSGGFPVQDVALSAGTALISGSVVASTSDATGTTLFIMWISDASATTLNIARLLKDTTTGNYYITNTTTLTVTSNNAQGMAVLGSNLYVNANIAATGALRRYSATDLSGVTTMTISGTNSFGNNVGFWADGTQLWVTSSSGNQRPYTVSGTTATAGSPVAFTSSGLPVAAVSDGTNVYMTSSTFNGTVSILKYPIAGGALTSTTSLIINANAWASANVQNPGFFMGSSTMLGLLWSFNMVSDTAKTGLAVHLMAIAKP